MADGAPNERLQPYLLDRITDEHPTVRRESHDRRVISPQEFRQRLLRDMSWLLNAACPRPADGLADYPNVARSVVNFGMPELAGETSSFVGSELVERLVREAIETFEPRVLPGESLKVSVVQSGDAATRHVVCL